MASEELARVNQERDAIADKSAKLELSNTDLRDKEARSKNWPLESLNLQETFRRLSKTFPQSTLEKVLTFAKDSFVGIDLEGMKLDVAMLEEEEGKQEEERVKKGKESERRGKRMAIRMAIHFSIKYL